MILLDPDLAFPGDSSQETPQTERQRRMPSARALGRFLREAQAAVRLRGAVSVLLTTDGEIRRLNRTFRGKNKATDVLSFPALEVSHVSKTGRHGAPAYPQVSGDLAISVDTARKQAAEQGNTLAVEVKVLMLHGLLHLAGFDHETDDGEMARRERLLRGRLGLPSGLIERAGVTHLNGSTKKHIRDRDLPTHPSGKNKNAARVGHPAGVGHPASRSAGPSTTRTADAVRSAQDDNRLTGRRV